MLPPLSLLLAASAAGLLTGASSAACNANSIPPPQVFGAKILDVSTKEFKDFTDWAPNPAVIFVADQVPTPISFCRVKVTYTHPGWNDTVHVDVELPLDGWNGRFLSAGGGGFAAGMPEGALSPLIALGYAAATTDGGHPKEDPSDALNLWEGVLTSPGNVNMLLLEDFASKCLGDLAVIGKVVTESFYGKAPKYSYWNGCSTGGRQGLMSAQRFPDAYDGILSAAPAINWTPFLVAEYWGQLVMNQMGIHPPTCEFHAITAAAIEACDELDGVKDGLISAPGLCKYDPMKAVGTKIDCNGKPRRVSEAAADVAKAIWDGPTDQDGKRLWYGLAHEASLHIPYFGPFGGLAGTQCDDNNENCVGAPFPIPEQWIRIFLQRDPDYDVSKMSYDDFYNFMHMSKQQYYSIMDTTDTDLSRFRGHGGKIIMWHGLADQLIFPNGSSSYYEGVEAQDANVRDWFRYFEAPGVGHCFGGVGPFPITAFQSLVDWVENGKAPDTLETVTLPNPFVEEVVEMERPACPYPLVAAFKGGDANSASSYQCASHFNAYGKKGTVTAAASQETDTQERDEL